MRVTSHTIVDLLQEVRYLLRHRDAGSRTVLCANAHIFNLAWKDEELREDLNSARVIAADGMSIVWFGRLLGAQLEQRCNMTEAFVAYLESAGFEPCRGVLVGLEPDEAAIAARAMMERTGHLTIVEVCSGYLTEKQYEAYFSKLNDIDLILVGMGSPRTERICQLASTACPSAVVWGIGAGTIRIFSGSMREAPRFMRRTGLQWLHRLVSEPRPLWRRYLIGNPVFISRMLCLTIRHGCRSITSKRIRESDSRF